MAKKRVAINGFGRIGRLVFRNLEEDPTVEVVAINDLTDNATLAHLLKYDSAHGKFNKSVSSDDNHITVDGRKIVASAIKNPLELPWKEMGVDVVIESTGIFRTAEKAGMHLEAGAKRVVISAPAKSEGVETVVLGVNGGTIENGGKIVSNASCTTNCLAPLVQILDINYGIKVGSVTTTHSYTSDQRIQDAPHSDLRRARAAAQNIVPTSTGAADAVALVHPPIKGKLSAIAVRVPTITGSLVEMNVLLENDVTIEEVNAKFKEASEKEFDGIIEYVTDPIVSSDVIGNKYSCIYDSLMTDVTHGNYVKVAAWYDNEAGYSARLAEVVARA